MLTAYCVFVGSMLAFMTYLGYTEYSYSLKSKILSDNDNIVHYKGQPPTLAEIESWKKNQLKPKAVKRLAKANVILKEERPKYDISKLKNKSKRKTGGK